MSLVRSPADILIRTVPAWNALLTLTTQGFGQHEPLLWLNLHVHSW
jgi:hypothetical protein